MNDIFTYSQKNGSTIFTFPGRTKVLSTSPLNGGITLPSDGMTAVPFPRISWLKVGSLTWPMGMAVPLTGAAIIFSSFSSPPNNFLSDPNILTALLSCPPRDLPK